MSARLDGVAFKGGLDQVVPPLSASPGLLNFSRNVEVDTDGGYLTPTGYEAYDGRPAPSDAVYYVIDVTISGSFSVGDTVTGATSGATAVVIAVSTADGYLAFTKLSGTFLGSEDLEVSATVEGTTTGTAVQGGASTPKLNAQYLNLAADQYRTDIGAVPGSGSVLGVWRLGGVQYAVRNNAGGTAAVLHKSSASGWTSVSLGRELSFTSGGTYEVLEGDTITGATSGATAVVTRVMLTSGSWSGGDAAGKFIFASQTGTFQSENLDVGANLNVATIAGDSSAITLSPDGRFETVIHNFGGQAGTLRVYGCDGVNRGFEFDGTVFAPIDTGVSTDAPTHVIVHKQQLFFSFASSAQHSGIATPYIFSPIFGAAELAVGDVITGFKQEPGTQSGEGALAIYSRNKTHILYGSSSSDWQMVAFRDEIGAFEYSIQTLSFTFFMDDRGVTSLQTVQDFGNFKQSSVADRVQPFILERQDKLVASCICREKNQYRIFFSDDFALYITVRGNKVIGAMPQLLDHTVTCIDSTEDSDGTEVIMFGSDDGFVYQMEKGTSFNGGTIDWALNTHFLNSGSPRVKKAYKGCALEVTGAGYAEASFTFELDYASTRTAQAGATQSAELNLAGARWGEFNWDQFFWDTVALSISEFKLGGSAENISLLLRGTTDYSSPLRFSGAIIRYIPRRALR